MANVQNGGQFCSCLSHYFSTLEKYTENEKKVQEVGQGYKPQNLIPVLDFQQKLLSEGAITSLKCSNTGAYWDHFSSPNHNNQ